MPLDRFPGAACGDAHHLVIVAGGAARGEGVVQPEAVLVADRVGVIGEGRRPLVGSDDEIRVIGVVALHVGRWNDLVADAVVGEIEQAAQIVLVTGHALLEVGLAVGRRRRALEHEAALGTDRNDDRILDHLRLDQAQDLGAEILRPVRPAQPSARDLAAAQMHALETRRVDEDFEHRLGLRQTRHLGGIELERQEALAAPGRITPPEVRARGRLNQREVLPQDAVFGQVLDGLQRRLDGADLLRGAGADGRALGGVEAQLEQVDELTCDVGVDRQRRLDESLRQREPDLPQVFCVRPQHDDLLGRQARRDHQPVEVVVLDLSAEHASERVGEYGVQRVDVNLGVADRQKQPQVVHPHRRRTLRRDAVRMLVEHLEAHVLEHRQAVGQCDRRAAMEKLEAQRSGRCLARAIQRHAERLGIGELRHHLDVGHGRARRELFAIARGKGSAELTVELIAARFADGVDQCILEVVFPTPRRDGQPRFQRVHVDVGNVARRRAHDDHDPRQRRL